MINRLEAGVADLRTRYMEAPQLTLLRGLSAGQTGYVILVGNITHTEVS